MHYLQKDILDKLRHHQPLAFTELMPDDIESSHFRYHLQILKTDKLVDKDKSGKYVLTHKGQQEVDYLSVGRATIARLPKVITYTLLMHGEKTLLYRKPKEPYRNLWGLIGGKVFFGEDTAHAAKRAVNEKTGLDVKLPQHCGVANIMIYDHGEPLSHVIAYVHIAQLESMPPSLTPELAVITPSELQPGVVSPDLKAVMALIQAGTFPFVTQIRCDINAA